MAAASSSVAKAWPSNWFVAIDWLLHVFRSLLPTTFLKAFSSTCGSAASADRGVTQLDENGNPLPVAETASKADDATSDAVLGQNVSRILEDQQAQHTAEGKATKSAKDMVRIGSRAQGKAQIKQKNLKSKRNEIGAKATKLLEHGEPHGTSFEVKNQKHDYKNQMKSADEEHRGKGDEEQQSLIENDSTKDDCKDEFNEAEDTSVYTDASHVCPSGRRDSKATDEPSPLEEKILEEKPSPSQGQSRRKRQKGKQNRSQRSKTDSTSKLSPTTISTNDPVVVDNVLPSSVVNPVQSAPFCCHQVSIARQKPSARVPPSRSTAVDPGLNSRTESSSDFGEKSPVSLSTVDDKRIDEERSFNVEYQETEKVPPPPSVEMSAAYLINGKSIADLQSSQSCNDGLAQDLSTEVIQKILPRMQPCITVQASVSACSLSPSRKQSTLIGQQGRVKPQSTVIPFSVLEPSNSAKPLHTVPQTLHPIPQARIRIEPVTGAKPKFIQPPRLKPRSLVHPVNPLRVDQSLQTRVRLHTKFDPISDLPKPTTPNDLPEIRTCTVNDPNPTFRILRRRPGTSAPMSKHSDSIPTETKTSVVTTEQCSNNYHSNGCYSYSNPSVAKTPAFSESSHRDSATTTKKKADVIMKKSSNSSLSDRKVADHEAIPESMQLSTTDRPIDAETRAEERVSGVRVGSYARDRFPSGSRTSLKNTGHQMNSCSSQVDENAVTFDLVRAQQYLRTEFLKTMELKKRGGNVKFLRL